MKMPAILLAAGASSRLGFPKQLVKVGGETLLSRTLRLLREAELSPITVVLGATKESIFSQTDLSAAFVVTNPNWHDGISSSIRSGLEATLKADPAIQAIMLLVCDQPALTAAHLISLGEAYATNGPETIVASQYAGISGIPAIFPASQFTRLLALKGDAGARYILRAPDCPIITIPLEGGDLDIDTPDDLKRLK